MPVGILPDVPLTAVQRLQPWREQQPPITSAATRFVEMLMKVRAPAKARAVMVLVSFMVAGATESGLAGVE